MSQKDPVDSKREALVLIAQIDERLAVPDIPGIERASLLSMRKNLVAAATMIDKTSMMKDSYIPGSNESAAKQLTADLLAKLQQGARVESQQRRNSFGKGPKDEGDAAAEHC